MTRFLPALLILLVSCHSALAGPQEDLFAAIEVDSPEGVAEALRLDADPNARNKRGFSPLGEALFNERNPDIVTGLLVAGADPNLRIWDGDGAMTTIPGTVGWFSADMTPLMLAVRGPETKYDRTIMVMFLLLHDADVTLTDAWGMTALHHAVRLNVVPVSPDVVRMLLQDKNAPLTVRDRDGWTPLMHACEGAGVEVVRDLIVAEKRGTPPAPGADGRTLAMIVADSDNEPRILRREAQRIAALIDAGEIDELKGEDAESTRDNVYRTAVRSTDHLEKSAEAALPISKLDFLLLIGFGEFDAQSADGQTLNSLLRHRTDREGAMMRAALEAHRSHPNLRGGEKETQDWLGYPMEDLEALRDVMPEKHRDGMTRVIERAREHQNSAAPNN